MKTFTKLCVASLIIFTNAWANPEPTPINIIPPAPHLNVKSYVLIDANSGKVIAEKNKDERLPPASMTKLMTIYVVSDALKQGQIHLDDTVTISKRAWKAGGSRMFLKEGAKVPVSQLIKGIIVASGNDACIALSEHVAGTEETFAQMMNQMATYLGLQNSKFANSTGWPHTDHYSTAYDLALLAKHYIHDFPNDYPWFKQKWITYNDIKQPNRNRLLWRDDTVDGVKTGHTDAAGYCLISSAKREDMRLISVVIGAENDAKRADYSAALLNYGFRFFKTKHLFSAGEPLIQPRVWGGKHKQVALGLEQPLFLTLPVGQFKNLKANVKPQENLRAPIVKGHEYGSIEIRLNDEVITNAPLVALENDDQAGLWTRTTDSIILAIKRLFS